MKLTTILFSLFVFCGIGNGFAQETARERLTRNREESQKNASVELSTRAVQMNPPSTDMEDAKWIREIYRYLDLSKEENAPLYYPVQPEQGRMNLFTMIFKLLAENRITAYEYLDGREVFTESYKIDFKEFLDRFGVSYEIRNGQITVDDADIPSSEVSGYFVKEMYYFKTGTSNYGVKTVAVCPVIHRMSDYETSTTRYPLFWVPYDEIMPYAMRMPIMASSINNTMTGSVDDFFRKRTYDGEIYKTANPRNLAISQYTSSQEERRQEQQKIERQLKDFESRLWKEDPDSTPVQPNQRNRRTKRNTTKPLSPESLNTMRDRRY